MERQEHHLPIHSKVVFRTNSRSIEHKDKYAPYRNYIKKKYGPNDPKYLQLARKNCSQRQVQVNKRKLKIEIKQDDMQTVLKQSRYRDRSFDRKSRPSSSKVKRQKTLGNQIQTNTINSKTQDAFLRRHSTSLGTNQSLNFNSAGFLQSIYRQNQKLRKQLQQLKLKQGSQEIKQLRNINEFLLKENYKLKNTLENMEKQNERSIKKLKELEQQKNKIQSQKSLHEEGVKSLKQILQKKKVTFKIQQVEAREQSFEKELQILRLNEQIDFLNRKIKDIVKKSASATYKKFNFLAVSKTVDFQFKPIIQQQNIDTQISQHKISIGIIRNHNNQRAIQFVRTKNPRRTSYEFRIQNFNEKLDGNSRNNLDRRKSKRLLDNHQFKSVLSSREKDLKMKIREQFHSCRKFYFSHESLAYEKRKLLTLEMIQRTITHKFKALNLTFQQWQQNACSMRKKLITVEQLFDILQSSPFSLPDNLTLLVIQYCFEAYVNQQDVCELSHFALKIRQFVKDYVPLTQQQRVIIEHKIRHFVLSNEIELKQSLIQKQNREGQVSQKIYQGVLKNFRISQKEINYIISKSIFISRDSNHINYRRFFSSITFNKKYPQG